MTTTSGDSSSGGRGLVNGLMIIEAAVEPSSTRVVDEDEEVHRMSPPSLQQQQQQQQQQQKPQPPQPQKLQREEESTRTKEDGPLFRLQMKNTEATAVMRGEKASTISMEHSLQQPSLNGFEKQDGKTPLNSGCYPPVVVEATNLGQQQKQQQEQQQNMVVSNDEVDHTSKNTSTTTNKNDDDRDVDSDRWYASWKQNLQECIHQRPVEQAILDKVLEKVYDQTLLLVPCNDAKNHNNSSSTGGSGCMNSSISINNNNNNNNKKHFMLIHGPRGTGKTRFVRSVMKKKTKMEALSTMASKNAGGGGSRGGGILVTGKFDQNNQLLAPFQAYVSAMTDYCNIVWEHGCPAAVAAAIHQAVGDEVQVLTNMIPALSRILDHTSTTTTAPICSNMANKAMCQKNQEHAARQEGQHNSGSGSSSTAIKRFLCAFQVLLGVLARLHQPLVLLLDGLQYADECSLDLLVMIVTNAKCSGGLLVIGTVDYDDADANDENVSSPGSSSSYLSAKLAEMKDGGNVTNVTIGLKNLEKEQVQQLLSETLEWDDNNETTAADCDGLATIVYDQTLGNQFYTYAYICRLVEQGLLVRNQVTGSWTLNDQGLSSLSSSMIVRNSSSSSSAAAAASNIQVFLGEQLRKYPIELMDVLKVASCFGSRIQEQLVSFVLGYPVDKHLKQAEKQGIIFYEKECGGYFFVHDIVQDAVDELTPEEDRELFHLEVGRRLWRKLDSVSLDRNIYIVLSQMRLGRRLISREKELVAIATLCLHAGNKAAESSSFRIACVYLTFGIDLLTGVSWRDQYDLLLALHNCAAEMLMYSANFNRMDEVVDSVIRHARVYEDKIQVYSTRIWALGVTDRQQECADLGVEVLKRLGVTFPRCLRLPKAYSEWKQVRKLLRGKTNEQLLRLPPLQDKRIAQILRILQFIQLHVLVARPKFAPFVLLKSIKLTLENGISVLAPLAFCSYAVLCGSFNRSGDAFRYSELALLMLKRMEVVEYLPRVYVMVYGFINGYKKDLRASLEPLLTAQCVGHQTGDLEYASVAASMYFINAVESGHSLQVILREALRYRSRMISSGQKTILRITEPHLEFVRCLIGAPGEALDFDKAIDEAKQRGAMKVIMALHLWRMRLAFLFRDYELAADQLDRVEQLITQISTTHCRIGAELVGGLTRAVLIRQGKNRFKNMRRLKQSIACFRNWAVAAPDQVSAKSFLLKAELESVRGNNQKALEYYTNSILISKGSDIVCDWALASEQAARHYLAIGDFRSSVQHMRAACEAYERWGASAKVAQLKAEIDASLCRHTIAEELYTMQSLYLQ